jgi:hypothetical protein
MPPDQCLLGTSLPIASIFTLPRQSLLIRAQALGMETGFWSRISANLNMRFRLTAVTNQSRCKRRLDFPI